MNHTNFSLATYSLIFLVSFIDVVMDWENMGGLNSHIVVEIAMGLVALVAFIVLFTWNYRQNKQVEILKASLDSTKQQLNNSKHQTQKLMGELSKIIQCQFEDWKLTKSEQEVASLLLKGLTLDEIASVRETRAKTVRQQASNLYKKAGISGRHELVAYFFEDLLIN